MHTNQTILINSIKHSPMDGAQQQAMLNQNKLEQRCNQSQYSTLPRGANAENNGKRIAIVHIGKSEQCYLQQIKEELGIKTEETTLIINRTIKYFDDFDRYTLPLITGQDVAHVNYQPLLEKTYSPDDTDASSALMALSKVLLPREKPDISNLLAKAVDRITEHKAAIVDYIWIKNSGRFRVQNKLEDGNFIKRSEEEIQEVKRSLTQRIPLPMVTPETPTVKAKIWIPLSTKPSGDQIQPNALESNAVTEKEITKSLTSEDVPDKTSDQEHKSAKNEKAVNDGREEKDRETGAIAHRHFISTCDSASNRKVPEGVCFMQDVPDELLEKFGIKTQKKKKTKLKRKAQTYTDQPAKKSGILLPPSPRYYKPATWTSDTAIFEKMGSQTESSHPIPSNRSDSFSTQYTYASDQGSQTPKTSLPDTPKVLTDEHSLDDLDKIIEQMSRDNNCMPPASHSDSDAACTEASTSFEGSTPWSFDSHQQVNTMEQASTKPPPTIPMNAASALSSLACHRQRRRKFTGIQYSKPLRSGQVTCQRVQPGAQSVTTNYQKYVAHPIALSVSEISRASTEYYDKSPEHTGLITSHINPPYPNASDLPMPIASDSSQMSSAAYSHPVSTAQHFANYKQFETMGSSGFSGAHWHHQPQQPQDTIHSQFYNQSSNPQFPPPNYIDLIIKPIVSSTEATQATAPSIEELRP